jgi:thiol-disulfide isomerase/thioredoxin
MNDFSNEIPKQPLMKKSTILLMVVLAGLGFALLLRELQPPRFPKTKFAGHPFPELVVEGWLNGPSPTPAEWNGKVRVIESWEYWCRPCQAIAPHMVDLHRRYRDRGVVFIGLTSEGAEHLELSRKFLEHGKITWPNGYGADPTLAHFLPDSSSIPNMWVVDKQGKVAWNGHPGNLPRDLLDELLQAPDMSE